MGDTAGERAYTLYKRAHRGRGVNGRKLPKWRNLTEVEKNEWESAALTLKSLVAVREAVHGSEG